MTFDFSPLRATRASLGFTLTMLACAVAQADDGAAAPRWTFGGYGTLGFVHSNDSQSDFTANVLNPGNAGASHEWSATVDSRVGMQLGVNLDSRWSAVLQVVSERTLQSGYAPMVEWANVKYQATPDLSLRVGRIALPLFLAGDYRKAGYALPWVRPPVEVYGAIPISNSDGVDASYRWSVAGINNVTQVFFGHTDVTVTPQAHATARAMTGLSNTTTSGALTVRASAMSTELTLKLARELFAGLNQFGPQGAALTARYDVDAKRADVISLGASYDPGAWFLMGEVGRMNARSYLGDKTAAYISGGYRFGDLTPYLSYAVSRANMPTHVAGLDLDGLPPQLAGAAAQLNLGLNQMLDTIPQQRSITAGVRWDLRANYAFKLQYDRLTPQQGSNGTFINVQPGFQSGRPISVFSASVDFVF
ncbi:porin [Duganella sp. S19_KUP01_CR8]|uniref:porin n=1 Tax=Duganella sp. S19_KUP01_CR8 TaxID=3025502 RepID=UPI002FCD8A2D